MMRLFFSEQYLASEHQFDTTRKAGWIAESLARVAIPGVETVEPRPLTEQALAMVHDAEYIAAVRTGQPSGLAQSQGFAWGPGLFPAVCASNGGMVAAALEALRHGVSGSLSSGLHHAKRARGAGYCTFNGLVIAARSALEAGAGLVLILDLDAHCGGGTASLIQGEPAIRQMDISVSAFDRYDSDTNSTLVMVDRSAEYLETIDCCLRESILESPGWCSTTRGWTHSRDVTRVAGTGSPERCCSSASGWSSNFSGNGGYPSPSRWPAAMSDRTCPGTTWSTCTG
jgi:hypothetical protein